MGMQVDTGGGHSGPKPDINVTPLVDIVLVLLIIFMVVLPDMQDGKSIDMLKVEAAEAFNPQAATVVTIDADEQLYINDEPATRDALLAALARDGAKKKSDQAPVLLRADAGLPYRVVRALLKDTQQASIGRVALAVGTQREWGDKP